MKTALWIVQAVLALAFGMAGFMKLATPHDQLAAAMPWVADAPAWLPKFIGAAELAGGIGLIAPALTRIKPWLTPLAAAGLVLVMALAIATHVVRGEFNMLPANLVLGALAAFVAWGRTQRSVFSVREARHVAPA